MKKKKKNKIKEEPPKISGWHSVWLFTIFDLPVVTKKDRKAYAQFRKELLNDGFTMMQYSVYRRCCVSIDHAYSHIDKIKHYLPSEGLVQFLMVTDKQFEKMQTFYGKRKQKEEKTPQQLEFF